MKLEDKPFVRKILGRFSAGALGTMRTLSCGHDVVERTGGRSAKAKVAVCTECRLTAARNVRKARRPAPRLVRALKRHKRITKPAKPAVAWRHVWPFSWDRVWAKYGVMGLVA